MSYFPIPLTSPEQATIRASGYWSRVAACLCPNEIVFQAQAAESITDDPFITFLWDNATIGAYGDVWENMVVFISATTDLRTPKYRGRVRLEPSATQFYISNNATILADGDYITVIRDIDLFVRERDDTLIDGSVAYHPLPPMSTGFPFSVVLYDADNNGTVDWDPAITAFVVDADASTIDSWLWEVSGGGASSISMASIQAPTITLEAGYHYLVRVTYEDDLGTAHSQTAHAYAITRTFSAPVIRPVKTGSVDGDLENGWTASLTAYGEVSDLIDRTHCVVWHVEHFGDDSAAPIVSNILMNGRIRSDTLQTEGSSEAGRVTSCSFAVEGITAYLRRLRVPNDIVRDVATPNEWGEGIDWNPYRMSVYALWAYTTLTHLGSFGAEAGLFAAWDIGTEPRSIDGGSGLDVLTSLLDPIKAYPNIAPSGEVYLARTVSYLEDRDDVETIALFGLQDMRDYTVERDSSRTCAQVIAYGGAFDSDANVFVLFSASSPSIVYTEGDVLEITRELLQADTTTTEAAQELSDRASNHFAYNNPKPLLRMSLIDSYAGVMIPTNYQRYAAVLPASSNTLSIPYTSSDYWQLQSVSLTINGDGSIDLSVTLPAETSFDDAQALANLLPENLDDLNPILPVLPNDPAFPTDSLELYPNDFPDLEDLQAIDPYSASQSMTPMPANVAAQMALNQGQPNSRTLRVLFNQETNTVSDWLTVNAAPYLLTLYGEAQISGPETCFDLVEAQYGWLPLPPAATNYIDGEGFARDDYRSVPTRLTTGKSIAGTITSVTVFFNENVPEWIDLRTFNPVTTYERQNGPATEFTFTGTFTSLMNIDVGTSGMPEPDLPSTLRLIGICYTIAGGTSETRGDAFYRWDEDEEGNRTNIRLHPIGEGLFIDNTKFAAIPPYSADNRYTNVAFTGTGNAINARMEFTDYSQVSRTYLYIDAQRQS